MAKFLENDFILRVAGVDYTGWHSVHFRDNMEELCNAFAVLTADYFPGESKRWKFKMGDPYRAFINTTLVSTGFIEDINVFYDTENESMEIKGRSKTLDLVDCQFDGAQNELKKQSISRIISNISAPFNVTVAVDSTAAAQAATIIDTFKASEGEFVAEMIKRLCNDNGIVPLNTPDGNILLTTATTTDFLKDKIKFGENATRGALLQSNANRYSKYIVKGYGNGNDNKSIEDYIQPSGEATDPAIKRNRPIVLFADSPTDSGKCKSKARWESRIRAGNSRIIEYEIDQWSQTNNAIWKKNTLTQVDDTLLGINQLMLLSGLDFIYNEDEGEITKVKMVDKDMYKLTADAVDIKLEFD